MEDNRKVEIKPEQNTPRTTVLANEAAQKEAAVAKDPFLTNMYMSSQRNSANMASMQTVANAKRIVREGKTIDDVKKSAEMLNLELEDSEIVQEKNRNTLLSKDKTLDKMAFDRGMLNQSLKNINDSLAIKSKETVVAPAVTSQNSNTDIEKTVELSVSSPVVQAIQTRIVGARQVMNTFMSDVARSMYQNYKPPVTAFRLNLNPAHLGNIAIVMKSEKDNGLSISMNVSNGSTLDSFVDNQGALRSALNRTFEGGNNISLNFNMQENGTNTSGQNTGKQDGQSSRNDSASTASNETLDEESTQQSQDSNYM